MLDLARRLSSRPFLAPVAVLAAGLVLAAAGLACAALLPGLAGAGIGAVTPLGIAALAASAPPGRLGQTMGAAGGRP